MESALQRKQHREDDKKSFGNIRFAKICRLYKIYEKGSPTHTLAKYPLWFAPCTGEHTDWRRYPQGTHHRRDGKSGRDCQYMDSPTDERHHHQPQGRVLDSPHLGRHGGDYLLDDRAPDTPSCPLQAYGRYHDGCDAPPLQHGPAGGDHTRDTPTDGHHAAPVAEAGPTDARCLRWFDRVIHRHTSRRKQYQRTVIDIQCARR